MTHFIRVGFFVTTGSPVGFNQWAGGLAYKDCRRGHHIINKSTKAIPYLNRAIKREVRMHAQMTHRPRATQPPTTSHSESKSLRSPGLL